MDQPCCQPVAALAEAVARGEDGGDDRPSPPPAGAVDELRIDQLSLMRSASEDGLSILSRKSSSRLENLPADLRVQILLSMPDFEALHRLVHASPVMYAQYRAYRTSILSALLDRELACVPAIYTWLEDLVSIADLGVMPLTDETLAFLKDKYYERYARKRHVCPYLALVEQNSLCSLAKQEKPRKKNSRIAKFISDLIFKG